MNNNTTIFFPDISGFTEFVTTTEIEHGRHIIAVLLEEIIKSNYLKFVVSEIEGDAILFYKSDNNPELNELLNLSLDVYNKFHNRLEVLNNSTHCSCGACSTIHKLKLKFIIHFGEVRTLKIYNFEKLYGLDVIIAHRLLKNNIDYKEYILVTQDDKRIQEEFKPVEGLNGPFNYSQIIPKIGTINAKYFTFKSSYNIN